MITALLVLFILFLLILFSPIIFSVSFKFPEGSEVIIKFWNKIEFSIINEVFSFSFFGFKKSFESNKNPKPKKKKPEEKKEKPKEKKRTNISDVFKKIVNVIGDENIRGRWILAIKSSAKRMFKIIKFQALNMSLNVGLDDPAQTGKFMGAWYAVQYACKDFIPSSVNVEINPDFYKKQVSGTAEIKAKTSVIKMLMPMIVFLWHAPLYKTYKMVKP